MKNKNGMKQALVQEISGERKNDENLNATSSWNTKMVAIILGQSISSLEKKIINDDHNHHMELMGKNIFSLIWIVEVFLKPRISSFLVD